MDDMLVRVQSRLDELGIAVKFSRRNVRGAQHDRARLTRGSFTQEYVVLHGPDVAFTDVTRAAGGELPVLVLMPYAGPRTSDAYRRHGAQFIDTAGNAWITFGDVLVDVRGRPRPSNETTSKRVAGNLFSAARAQVVCALLAWPHLWHASRRDLARAAGVSLGHASVALELLAAAGYKGDETKPGQTPLLELWAAAFPTGLAPNLTTATFRGDIAEIKLPEPDQLAFISGERAATDLLHPATLVLYVERWHPRTAMVNRWRSDGPPNITVRRAFWRTPDVTAPKTGVAEAPWPLVYADLLATDDPRARRAARVWRERNA